MKPTTVKDFFAQLPGQLDAEAADGVAAVYQFDLSGPEGGQYYVEIRNGACRVVSGTHSNPHVTLSMAGEDCVKVLNGAMSGPAVAMSGRLRIAGDLGLAIQLKALFPGIG